MNKARSRLRRTDEDQLKEEPGKILDSLHDQENKREGSPMNQPMRMRKWFVLSFVILAVWTVISLWAMDKGGVLKAVQRQCSVFSARTTIERYLASTLECESFKSAPAQITFLAGLIQTLSHETGKPFSTL